MEGAGVMGDRFLRLTDRYKCTVFVMGEQFSALVLRGWIFWQIK